MRALFALVALALTTSVLVVPAASAGIEPPGIPRCPDNYDPLYLNCLTGRYLWEWLECAVHVDCW